MMKIKKPNHRERHAKTTWQLMGWEDDITGGPFFQSAFSAPGADKPLLHRLLDILQLLTMMNQSQGSYRFKVWTSGVS